MSPLLHDSLPGAIDRLNTSKFSCIAVQYVAYRIFNSNDLALKIRDEWNKILFENISREVGIEVDDYLPIHGMFRVLVPYTFEETHSDTLKIEYRDELRADMMAMRKDLLSSAHSEGEVGVVRVIRDYAEKIKNKKYEPKI